MNKKYRVKLTYKYSAFVEVEAESKEDAENIAVQNSDVQEEFECLYDAEAKLIED